MTIVDTEDSASKQVVLEVAAAAGEPEVIIDQGHVPPEDIASFVDVGDKHPRSAAMRKHMAACTTCFDAYEETVKTRRSVPAQALALIVKRTRDFDAAKEAGEVRSLRKVANQCSSKLQMSSQAVLAVLQAWASLVRHAAVERAIEHKAFDNLVFTGRGEFFLTENLGPDGWDGSELVAEIERLAGASHSEVSRTLSTLADELRLMGGKFAIEPIGWVGQAQDRWLVLPWSNFLREHESPPLFANDEEEIETDN
jgi:hypothetical protein